MSLIFFSSRWLFSSLFSSFVGEISQTFAPALGGVCFGLRIVQQARRKDFSLQEGFFPFLPASPIAEVD